jgi:sugar O-acyltransferase (sialic acid O-acetyltransferase NeuD family)
MKPTVIFGTGKIADVVVSHMIRDGSHDIIGFTCDDQWVSSSTHKNRPLIPFTHILDHFPPSDVEILVAIGYQDLNAIREQVLHKTKELGYKLTSYVSRLAGTGDWYSIGENSVILDGVGIQPGTRIGSNVFVWNNSLIGHHSEIQDHCWLAAGTTIGGSANVGKGSFIGLNSTIGNDVALGERCFVGAGTCIFKSAPERTVFITPGTQPYRLNSDDYLRMSRLSSMTSRPR